MRSTLSSDPRLEVVGIASDGVEAVELARDLAPDVVVLDVDQLSLDGGEATRQICETDPSIRVLALVGPDSHVESDLARQGAAGFIRKDRSAAELAETLPEVASMVLALGAARSAALR
jgi:DNA-binding NarL/FixJ family response regulator